MGGVIVPGKKEEHLLNLTVIVSGAATQVKVNIEEKLDHVAREALRESGNAGQAPDRWELRKASGELLDMAMRTGDAGLSDGDTLTLQPKSGHGGER